MESVGKHPVGTKPDGKRGGRKLTKPPAEHFGFPGKGLKKAKDYQLDAVLNLPGKKK